MDDELAEGFIRDPAGNITKIEPPNSQSSGAYAIDSSGTIAGIFEDDDNFVWVYLRDPLGNYTWFWLPNFESFFGGIEQPTLSMNSQGVSNLIALIMHIRRRIDILGGQAEQISYSYSFIVVPPSIKWP